MSDCDICGGTSGTYTRPGKGMCLLCEVVLLEAEVARLTELLRDVATCAPVDPDRRMDYVEVQIDWQTWDASEPFRKPLTPGRG